MKLILRQYLEGINERGELDSILPALLSELGFEVLSRPGRGTRQYGVDVAAIGPDEEDKEHRKLFLFTIKPGNLDRAGWDNSPQAVRQSLNEIVDKYITSEIAEHHRRLEIVVCLCVGGEIKENVRGNWTGYVNRHHKDNISFREWNGDKLAGLLLSGILKEELLEPHLRKHFQKSIAMLDHPDVSYQFFVKLTRGLLEENVDERKQLTRLRQVYICLWVLYVWAREADNLEAPLRASEYAVLQVWDYCRSIVLEKPTEQDERVTVLDQVIKLYLIISESLLMDKLGEYVDIPFAVSRAVASGSSVDVNLALFEQLGRFSLYGLWQYWLACCHNDENNRKTYEGRCIQALEKACQLIRSNPALLSPLRDDFAIEIALFMMLARVCNVAEDTADYLEEMARRLLFSINQRFCYPISETHYHDLIEHAEHSHGGSEDYFKEHTRGSVLYPLIVVWLDRLGLTDARDALADCIERRLSHTTQQVWVPDKDTDESIWRGEPYHGTAVTLEECKTPQDYAALVERSMTDNDAYDELSTTKSRLWPILLMACRHFRLPVPPHMWFDETDKSETREHLTQNGKDEKIGSC